MALDKLAFIMSLIKGNDNSKPIDSQVNSESENVVQNKAIYDFVNSSVASNTAYFKGTYSSVAELETIADATNNDYAFVISVDADGNTVYNRYKYSVDDWLFEYALNNSSFTANQWNTINSGITSVDIQNLEDGKVDKVSGMGLSKNDFTDEEKQKLSDLENYDDTQIKSGLSEVNSALADKVDKVTGKQLSTNDFTDADKSKLDSLENYDDADVKTEIAKTDEQVALNRSTLGYQRKNFLKNTAVSQTRNGVSFTVNDGVVKVITTNPATTTTTVNTIYGRF